MEISGEHLLGYPVADVVQTVSRKDTALYAVSTGFGQNPMEGRELAFVDPEAEMAVSPSMALVLGYPGFWLGRDDTGVDAAKVSHVEQQVILHSALPNAGTVCGRTSVTGLFGRSEGKELVLTSQREIMAADNGALLATLCQTHFLRGNSCASAPAYQPPVRSALRDGPPALQMVAATRPEQALLYRLNGDMNPLHIQPAVARRAGFAAPILHGMCTFGVATRALVAGICNYDPTVVSSISMRFRAPVFPGETLRTDIWLGGYFEVRVLERDMVVVDNGLIRLKPDGAVSDPMSAAPAAAPTGFPGGA